MTEWLEAHNQEELDELLARHGENLRVRIAGQWNGDVHVAGRSLRSLDASGAQIGGALCASRARISGALDARGAQIGGALSAYGAQIGGTLDARGARIRGVLDAHGAQIGGALDVREALISGVLDANGAQISGAVYAAGRGGIRDGILMPDVMHGARGVAIAQCDGYILWLGDDGYYRAGCRGPFTRDEALAHWDRQDKRARVFSAAIARENSVQRDGERSA